MKSVGIFICNYNKREFVVNCVKSLDYTIKGLTYSSIKGPAGNIEYLIWFTTAREDENLPIIEEIVEAAHSNLP